jgi:hypothetical protein
MDRDDGSGTATMPPLMTVPGMVAGAVGEMLQLSDSNPVPVVPELANSTEVIVVPLVPMKFSRDFPDER